MNMNVKVSAILSFFLCIIGMNNAAKLPTYLTQCSIRDPKLNDCFKRNANLAIPFITKGDIHYDIPSLKPLSFSQPFNIRSEADMTLTINDFILQGLETTKVIDLNFDLVKSILIMDLEIPNISTAGSYNLKGNAYGFPVWKIGHFNGKLDGVKIQYSNSFVSSKIDGEDFFSILSSKANYTVEKESYDYQGLLNRYYFGSEIREAYKVNVQEVGTEMKVIINKNVADFISNIFTGIFSRVPKNDFFKP